MRTLPIAESSGGEAPGDTGSGTGETPAPPQSGPEGAPSQPAFRFFSPTSLWNQELAPAAPLDPTSIAAMEDFDGVIASEQSANTGPWMGTSEYSVPIYTVPVDQATVAVKLEHTPAEVSLSSAWSAVPLPANAKPAAGHDGNLVVWQPSRDRLWEFWKLAHDAEGWHAAWGGAMQNVSSDNGVFGTGSWPGSQAWWGVSASSLSIAGGLVTFEDLEHGKIEHALALAIPNVRAGVYASPARRSDGKSLDPLALPEGAHLRLNPNLDLGALHLPKLTLMLAEAAQRYGIYVRDGSGNVQFFGQDPSSLPSNPYTGSSGYFEGMRPIKLLSYFPWKELELLKMELHKTTK